MQRIYLDNSATTKVDPRVVEEMLPYFSDNYGNPSSLHTLGREAKDAIDSARGRIAACLNASPDEIVFTGSGTEANNFALKGVAFANRQKGNHIIVSRIEHDSILNPCRWLKDQRFEIEYLPVQKDGLVEVDELKKRIKKETVLVSIMHANNEVGTIEPVEAIGAACRERGVYFHTDACQSFGKIIFDPHRQQIDLATINAHKIYGPKGVGALFIRKGVKISSWQQGGGQEMGLRSATENIPAIMGFAKAVELCFLEFEKEDERLRRLRDKIIDHILEQMPSAYLNGSRERRLSNNVNIGFYGLEGEAITLQLKLDEMGIFVSTGSACSSNGSDHKASHVLSSLGLDPIQARGALRISLGRYNTEEEVDRFLEVLPKAIAGLKSIASVLV